MRTILYVARRLLLAIPVVFVITTVVFMGLRVLPGDPVFLVTGALGTPETRQRVTEALNLDEPLVVQYGIFLKGLVRGDLGQSLATNNDIRSELSQRIPATLELITFGLLAGLAFGVPLGVLGVAFRGGLADLTANLIAVGAASIPVFFLALLLIYGFYDNLRIVPPPFGRIGISVDEPTKITGFYLIDSVLTWDWAAFRSAAGRLVLPVVTLGFVVSAPIIKQVRSAVSETLRSPYVDYARLLGLPRRVVWQYVMRNALIPIITISGILFTILIGGAVLVETVFGWGGVGQYAVQASANFDYPAIQGFIVAVALLTVVTYLVVDLLYVVVDPRIKL